MSIARSTRLSVRCESPVPEPNPCKAHIKQIMTRVQDFQARRKNNLALIKQNITQVVEKEVSFIRDELDRALLEIQRNKEETNVDKQE